MIRNIRATFFWAVFVLINIPAIAQQDTLYPYVEMNYQNPRKVVIEDIQVRGVTFFDPNVVRLFSGLSKGQEISIPGDDITSAINNLWKQKLFTDIRLLMTESEPGKVILIFELEERPKLLAFSIKGLRKSKAKSLREQVTLERGDIVTDNLKQKTIKQIKDYYIEKGYLNTQVEIEETLADTVKNLATLKITVKPGERTKISEIIIEGNEQFTDKKLRRVMKSTKQKGIRFKRSKYIEEEFQTDKDLLITFYNSKGHRDARIIGDSVYPTGSNLIGITLKIYEGPKYYFRNITWTGNSKYRSSFLDTILGIKKGEIYDLSKLESRLYMSPASLDVSSIYMDDGYLFFNVTPVEVQVENDSIDIEIRITEGPQALVNKVTVSGNTKTSDYVIIREIRVRPGQKFSRSDIQRSVRELAGLGYFDPEKIEVTPKPNYAAGTVDIEFKVEERPSDQIELSGGFGAGTIVGTLGLNLTNFSTKKMFNKNAWTPIPSGDGQRLSVRAQSNGTYFQSYNFSFTEPWFGGKRPNSLSFSVYHSIQTDGRKKDDPLRQSIKITGVTLGYGRLNKWPDDYFTTSISLTYQHYLLNNFSSVFSFATGTSDNVNVRFVLSRNSVDQPIYPRSGSQFTASLQITPPFSIISNKDYSNATDQEKYRLVEYHKWKFDAAWYTTLVGKLVLATQAKFGFMGYYNPSIGPSPFERFYLGGAGLIGFNLDGRELISMRGYKDNSVTPLGDKRNQIGATIYNKYTMELRYPLSLNPQATVYGLAFAEAGHSWSRFRDYKPFDVLRSAGVGVRVFLPMFGLLGLDYGIGFDENPYQPGSGGGQLHFFIGQQF